LKNRINLAFGLALLVLVVVAVASYRNITRLRADVNWMEHTYDVSRTIQILFLKIAEGQAGERGFIITADPAFIERFSLAEQSIPPTLDALRELTKDNPGQQGRLDTLQQLVTQKLAFARENMEIRRKQGLEASAELVGTGRAGYRLMDQISAVIAEMQQEETELLVERNNATDQTIRQTTWVIAAGLLLAFLVVPFAGLVTGREIGRRAQAEGKFRALLESAPDAMVIVNRAGQVVLLNSQAEKLFGYAREELLGQRVEILIPERLRGGHPNYRAGYFDEPRSRGMGVGMTLLGLTKEGKEFPVEISLSPIETDEGVLVSGAIRDITVRKRAEEALRRAYADLEAVNKELEAFTYSVSHDLRAPLRHVDGFAKLLCEEFSPHLDSTAQHYLGRIQSGTRQMAQLVDDLLNLARVGRQEVRRQVTGLNSLVKEVLAELKPEAQDRQVDWRIGSLPFADCDPTLMKQVFANLLSNALKFTRTRPSAIVEVGQVEANGQPVIFVRDNGVGFSMKYADKLFGVFQRLHRAEDFEGTGVGLATVQRIVHKHGGQVWAEAELDKGATFFFTLGSSESPKARATAHTAKEATT
jgi:PAS domain S-box-containing protein